ncbi:MAG: MFS transporter [Hyphomonadaceae bacterium]
MGSIRSVASLILALALLQLGQGVLGVHLPLAMDGARFTKTDIGFITAANSAGFVAGAWFGPIYLARIGHTRLFAAGAAATAVVTLALNWADGVMAWMALRFAAGATVALMFCAGESWLAGSIPSHERGHVIGFNQVGYKAVAAFGPFLVSGAAPTAPDPWMVSAIIMMLSLLPIAFTSREQPAPASAQPLGFFGLYKIAPAAVVACVATGLVNSGMMTLAPLYAQERFGGETAATFYAAAWLGGLVVQWPAGKLSDMMDRRLVIVGLIALAAAGAGALAMLDGLIPFYVAAFFFGLWGAGSLSYYGVAFVHMADEAGADRLAAATTGLLLVWALGAIIGPAIIGYIVDATSIVSLFWYCAIVSAGAAAAILLYRRRAPLAAEPA